MTVIQAPLRVPKDATGRGRLLWLLYFAAVLHSQIYPPLSPLPVTQYDKSQPEKLPYKAGSLP